jgi:hypothetical protein
LKGNKKISALHKRKEREREANSSTYQSSAAVCFATSSIEKDFDIIGMKTKRESGESIGM